MWFAQYFSRRDRYDAMCAAVFFAPPLLRARCVKLFALVMYDLPL